ncbi:hypothetical protein CI105_05730 [Candidatus Izimaplasma bacterium ZiA1]|uniref:DUF3137 domain-containing protein n=1 Tax=Candidatus Izimoplasma sp. ZiA1 TaxID=2024899 RepID=UPI000BAA4076|nr:hypothetical protein CI105_05730 [Candidatus Izimaplasma bacterium ZiA1]
MNKELISNFKQKRSKKIRTYTLLIIVGAALLLVGLLVPITLLSTTIIFALLIAVISFTYNLKEITNDYNKQVYNDLLSKREGVTNYKYQYNDYLYKVAVDEEKRYLVTNGSCMYYVKAKIENVEFEMFDYLAGRNNLIKGKTFIYKLKTPLGFSFTFSKEPLVLTDLRRVKCSNELFPSGLHVYSTDLTKTKTLLNQEFVSWFNTLYEKYETHFSLAIVNDNLSITIDYNKALYKEDYQAPNVRNKLYEEEYQVYLMKIMNTSFSTAKELTKFEDLLVGNNILDLELEYYLNDEELLK